jgi:hypothetical protein
VANKGEKRRSAPRERYGLLVNIGKSVSAVAVIMDLHSHYIGVAELFFAALPQPAG